MLGERKEVKQVTFRGPVNGNAWDSILRSALSLLIGKEISVGVRENSINNESVYPEPYNLTLEKVEGDKVFFSLPLDRITQVDEERY
jgi:hypothetical protein